MCQCAIQWIDVQGNATPDTNQAIGHVMLPARIVQACGRGVAMDATKWFPICAEHAKRLQDHDMVNWVFKPIAA